MKPIKFTLLQFPKKPISVKKLRMLDMFIGMLLDLRSKLFVRAIDLAELIAPSTIEP
jgi:hypothetical protein